MKTSFDKAKHRYLIDGKPATGVTTIIGILDKQALIPWAARMVVEKLQEQPIFEELKVGGNSVMNARLITPEMLEEARTAHTKKKEAAGTHGTDAHALVEMMINRLLERSHGRIDDSEWVSDFEPIKQFWGWAEENVDHFLYAERKMFNKRLFIAGTADFAYIGKDGKRYMADFKTSSGIYGIGYWLQVAGYRMLAEEEGDAPYDGATIVRMGKDGSFDVQQLYEYETYKEAFLCCLTLYRANAAIKGLVVK